MSDREHRSETVADIVAEMLERADAMQTHGTTHGVRLAIREFARRINAAYNRERSKVEADALAVGGIIEATRTAEKSSAVGNAAAMRDALLNIQEYAAAMDVDDGNVLAILDACRDALSAPARNCDVGTAEEQRKRFRKYCGSRCMTKCRVYEKGIVLGIVNEYNYYKADCRFVWSQMPYEAEEGGAE